MAVESKNDLESFHRFVEEQLNNGGARLSPEQVLAMWRERLETIESIRRGIEDVEAGRTRPAVRFSNEAEANVREIRDWIAKRSQDGALRWLDSFERARTQLSASADSFGLRLKQTHSTKSSVRFFSAHVTATHTEPAS